MKWFEYTGLHVPPYLPSLASVVPARTAAASIATTTFPSALLLLGRSFLFLTFYTKEQKDQ